MNGHTLGGALAASVASIATTDELQSLIVALLALGVRELVYWLQHRRKKPQPPTVVR